MVDLARDIAGRTGARITVTDEPREAVSGVDFIHTDVWVSMEEAKDVWTSRVKLLTPTRSTPALLKASGNPAVKFMHCLPAYHDTNTTAGREIMEHTGMTDGLEVTGDVFSSSASIVFDQAENASTPSKPSSSLPWDNSSPVCIRAALSRPYRRREVVGKRGERVRL